MARTRLVAIQPVPERRRRFIVKPDERRRLLWASQGIGLAMRDLINIVTPHTDFDWVLLAKGPRPRQPPTTRKPGRPRNPEEIRELVLRMHGFG